MLKYSLLLFVVASLLLCHQLNAKKVKEKPKHESIKADEHVHHHSPLNNEPHPHQEFGHSDVNGQNNNDAADEKERLVKPKSLKTLSAYEKCKLECKRQRDQESAHEYVERLREELRRAEEQLAQRDDRVIEL
ncbi:hypothetical protein M3Y97_00586600 [Aphelenchoides bicaudatus]|nr:hypothetical protein M3Y97_00586600 [Aphelenchoides bicaudatus]